MIAIKLSLIMPKRNFMLLAGITISALIGIVFAVTCRLTNDKSLFERNVEALTEEEVSSVEMNCRAEGGLWNYYSFCVDGGVTTCECTKEGELSILGVKLHGKYSVGGHYILIWERFTCQKVDTYCCTKQGVFVREYQSQG